VTGYHRERGIQRTTPEAACEKVRGRVLVCVAYGTSKSTVGLLNVHVYLLAMHITPPLQRIQAITPNPCKYTYPTIHFRLPISYTRTPFYSASHPSSNSVFLTLSSSLPRYNGLTTCILPVPSLTLWPMIIHSLTPSIVSVLPLAAASKR
jgi:hypothetical protein